MDSYNNLVVYNMLENKIEEEGLLQNYQSISYTVCFDDVGTFTLTIPFTQEDFNLLLPEENLEKIIYLDRDFQREVYGICNKVEVSTGQDDGDFITVSGNLIEGIMLNSVIQKTVYFVSASYIQSFIDMNMSLEENSITRWKGLSLGINSDLKEFKIPEEYNFPGGTLSEFIHNLCVYSNTGYRVTKNEDNSFTLMLNDFTDKTINQSENSPVLISTKFENLINSEFSINTESYKNVIIATAEYNNETLGKGSLTSTVTYDEYENDISNIPNNKIRASFESELDVDFSNATTIEQAKSILNQAAKQKLYEYGLVKSYECSQLAQSGTFFLNRDYILGDKVTVYDDRLGLSMDAQVTEVTKNISQEGITYEPTFGYAQPTLNRILRQKGVI